MKKTLKSWPVRITLVLLAIAGGLGGRALLSARAKDRRWEEFQGHRAELQDRFTRPELRREPLEGDGTGPGDAAEFYAAAGKAMDAISDEEEAPLYGVMNDPLKPESIEPATLLFEKHPEVLAQLKRGAARGSFTTPFKRDDTMDVTTPWLRSMRRVVRAASTSARLHRLDGRLDAAVDDIALGLQLSLDIGGAGPFSCWYTGVGCLSITLWETRHLARDPALSRLQMNRLETLLARTDSLRVPFPKAFESLRLEMRAIMEEIVSGRKIGWHQGFLAEPEYVKDNEHLLRSHAASWKVAAADLDDFHAAVERAVREQAGQPWSSANEAYRRLDERREADPLFKELAIDPWSYDHSARFQTARLRMLQALLRERREGAPAVTLPTDPFSGAPLHRREDPAHVVYWSDWKDGDGGGKGDWVGAEEKGDDIVVEMRR